MYEIIKMSICIRIICILYLNMFQILSILQVGLSGRLRYLLTYYSQSELNFI